MKTPRPFRVLICQQDQELGMMCANDLRARGYEVLMAPNGEACVNLALSTRLDAAIIDTELRDVDGYKVARRIRAEDRRARVRLIATAPLHSTLEVAKTRSAGFDLLVTKPVRMAQLVVALETLRAVPTS